MSERYLCIHGHFYQPPRESPWLEEIELQDSAHPYHDWNERITEECFAPNTAARILDTENRIVKITNNFANISFNVGPTLLSWLEQKAPQVYAAIVEADRESAARFSGHGSALAQAYNHTILPLGNRRHKYIQVLWGIRDFEHRFGRYPEGMWLPETAVDLETLEVLAELDIRFTVLAPNQAAKVRPIGESEWTEVDSSTLDTTTVYRCKLPSGKSICLFFYNGPVARAVAFEGLLNDGETFTRRLVSQFAAGRKKNAQLVHIATDGETYGHHHRHGEMALAYALDFVTRKNLARLTNYGEFLESHPPRFEVKIHENTSWSCAHGIERWRSDCGCRTGGEPGWTQMWRAPLRKALNWLDGKLCRIFEKQAADHFKDPLKAADEYVGVLLDRSDSTLDRFFSRHHNSSPEEEDRIKCLKLLEMLRQTQLMFTSCGWFFNELSGIETVQVLQYAGRALQLAEGLGQENIENEFLKKLKAAPSNLSTFGHGRNVYDRLVKPNVVDLSKVCAHFALGSLFQESCQTTDVFCYRVECRSFRSLEDGNRRLSVGVIRVWSRITREAEVYSFCAADLGNRKIRGGINRCTEEGESEFELLLEKVGRTFSQKRFSRIEGLIDEHFNGSLYSLHQLFRDRQRTILRKLMRPALEGTEASYRQVYERNMGLMVLFEELEIPLPEAFVVAARYFLNQDLRRVLETDPLDMARFDELLDQVERHGVELDAARTAFSGKKTVQRLAERLEEKWKHPDEFYYQAEAIRLIQRLSVELEFWSLQNAYYRILRRRFPGLREKAGKGDPEASRWISRFSELGELLSFDVPK